MNHALIIDDNMIISRAIQSCLEPLGFDSFDHVWTEQQAVTAADRRPPDLVVIGDEVERGSALDAARRISRERAVPVLMVTGDPVRARKRLAEAGEFKGPFLLNQIEEAVRLARNDVPQFWAGRNPEGDATSGDAQYRQRVTATN